MRSFSTFVLLLIVLLVASGKEVMGSGGTGPPAYAPICEKVLDAGGGCVEDKCNQACLQLYGDTASGICYPKFTCRCRYLCSPTHF
ncbi:hypothetical protein ACOSP7_020711 [Xanthoceras sorbifolium]